MTVGARQADFKQGLHRIDITGGVQENEILMSRGQRSKMTICITLVAEQLVKTVSLRHFTRNLLLEPHLIKCLVSVFLPCGTFHM